MRTDADWAVPATIFVAIQFAAGIILSQAVGFGPKPPIFDYLAKGGAFVIFAGLFGVLFKTLKMMRSGTERPATAIMELVRNNRPTLLLAAWGCVLVALQIAALTWLKLMLPLVVPFWADPMLAELDRVVFGTDPWRFLYPMPPLLHWVIDAVYILWFPIKACALLAILSLGPSLFKSRALLAYFLTVGLFGVIGQYAISSAGPIFYHLLGYGSEFRDLPSSGTALVARDYLWSVYLERHASFGAGISAMPSIHVAVAAWLALSIQSIWRWLAPVGWAFYLLILVGSVYLGWHYVSDGVVGTIAALLSWKLSAVIIGRRAPIPESRRLAIS